MFSLSLVLNALPIATQIAIINSIKDNLRQYVSLIRHVVFYAALVVSNVKEHFKEQNPVVKRTLGQILFKTNQNYKYEKSGNHMAPKREPCRYEN